MPNGEEPVAIKRGIVWSEKSDELLKYPGQNPFAESQGRSFSRSKVEGEFHPTSTFLDRINQQHEILLGTRGSGKTFLLPECWHIPILGALAMRGSRNCSNLDHSLVSICR